MFGLTLKETKGLFINVFNEHIDNIVNDLKLNQRPEYKFVDDNNDFVMATGGNLTFESYGFFSKIIVESNADYVLKVNIKALKRMLIRYRLVFGKKAVTDIILVLLLHECRHMWQYQGNFFIGKEYNSLDVSKTSSYVHGYVEEEMDANKYACYYSKTKGNDIFALSLVMKSEQENGKNLKKTAKNAKKEYGSLPIKAAISIIGIASYIIIAALIVKKIVKNKRGC